MVTCNWCQSEDNEHKPHCQAPRIDCNEKGEPQYWTIKLNKYQRDNLAWLINAIGYPYDATAQNGPVEPFTCANTGDWVGEVFNMLKTVESEARPNKSIQELRKEIDHWLLAAKVHLT